MDGEAGWWDGRALQALRYGHCRDKLNTQTNWRQIILKLRGETKIINKEKAYLDARLNSYFMNNVTKKHAVLRRFFITLKFNREEINSSILILLTKHLITAHNKTLVK